MRFPTLSPQEFTKQTIDSFKGYNHNLRIGEGEFYDMKNLTSTHYPVLSPRSKRGVYAAPINPQGLIAKDSLCYVDGSKFVINGNSIDIGLSEDENMCPKQLISMGAYVIIMPDKMWINTADLTDFGNIEAEYLFPEGETVTFELCQINGESYSNVRKGTTAPTITDDMKKGNEDIPLWLDISSKPHSLKIYSLSQDMWATVPTTYIKISCPQIDLPFNQYDGVTISGVTAEALKDLNNTMVIWDKGEGYIVVQGIIDEVMSQDTPITVERRMPLMDFIIESENRLFGCRYGPALNGEIVNEIYVSKLGDFKNWNCFMGLSTDSYVASCGTDGQFTGAITHLGYPLFFKETCVHKIYGNYPANFQIQTTTCRGVQKGSHNSLAIVNEVLFYKSRSAVCTYDGSLPTEISYQLGDITYSDAIACSHGNKYYISMKDVTDSFYLFVYDAAKGMWHKEDGLRADAFCSCRGELYFIDNSDKKIKTVGGSGTVDTLPVEWIAETGIIGVDSPDNKYISRLNIRMSLDIGTDLKVYIQYDSCREWEQVYSVKSTSLHSFFIPIRPKRCDHFRLKLEGKGDAKIFSITKTFEHGSDL